LSGVNESTFSASSVVVGPDSSRDSAAMEHLLELAFVAELTQEAWFGRGLLVDVLHSSVDAFGHDLVLECGPVLRHVQLKGRAMSGSTPSYNINTKLAEQPSGCVVWIGWERAPESNRLRLQYRWFGGEPGSPLPHLGLVIAKHSKANASGVKIEPY
jgi:hypothetical protein